MLCGLLKCGLIWSSEVKSYISWLELTPRSFVPLATLKSKVLPIQLAKTLLAPRNAVSSIMSHAFWIASSCYRVLGRCPGGQARSMSWFRTKCKNLQLQEAARSCSEVSVWCQASTRVLIESNLSYGHEIESKCVGYVRYRCDSIWRKSRV